MKAVCLHTNPWILDCLPRARVSFNDQKRLPRGSELGWWLCLELIQDVGLCSCLVPLHIDFNEQTEGGKWFWHLPLIASAGGWRIPRESRKCRFLLPSVFRTQARDLCAPRSRQRLQVPLCPKGTQPWEWSPALEGIREGRRELLRTGEPQAWSAAGVSSLASPWQPLWSLSQVKMMWP